MTELFSSPNQIPLFPKSVVVSLEGEADTNSLSDVQNTTFELPTFIKARQELETYLTDYQAGRPRTGVALGIKGDFGSGKTHMLLYLRQFVKHNRADGQQIYVKVESDSFLSLYRHVAKQIDYQTIYQLKTHLLSEFAKREVQKGEISKTAVEILDSDPDSVFYYLKEGLISPSKVKDAYLDWVQDITYHSDFTQAVLYLQDPLLGEQAYQWLLGEKLSDTTLRRLGIHRFIDDDDRAKIALRLIVTLFSQARLPLLLYIDQIERLILDTTSDRRSINIGAIHSLAEKFEREQGFLCLAGYSKAWKILPEDFFARLGFRVFELSPLSISQALNLVKTYLHPSVPFDPYQGEDDISPYTKDAVSAMLKLGQGNIRELLFLAYQTSKEREDNQEIIDKEFVYQIARKLDRYELLETGFKEENFVSLKASWLLTFPQPQPTAQNSKISNILKGYNLFPDHRAELDLAFLFGEVGGFWSGHPTYAILSTNFLPEVILVETGGGKTAFAHALTQTGNLEGIPLAHTLPITISGDNLTLKNAQNLFAGALLDFVCMNPSAFRGLTPEGKNFLIQLWVNRLGIDLVKARLIKVFESDKKLVSFLKQATPLSKQNQKQWLQQAKQCLDLLGFDQVVLALDFNRHNSRDAKTWLRNMQHWADHLIIPKLFLPEALGQEFSDFLNRVKTVTLSWNDKQITQMAEWRFASLTRLASIHSSLNMLFEDDLYPQLIEHAQGNPQRLAKLWSHLFDDHLNNSPNQRTFSSENLARAVEILQ